MILAIGWPTACAYMVACISFAAVLVTFIRSGGSIELDPDNGRYGFEKRKEDDGPS